MFPCFWISSHFSSLWCRARWLRPMGRFSIFFFFVYNFAKSKWMNVAPITFASDEHCTLNGCNHFSSINGECICAACDRSSVNHFENYILLNYKYLDISREETKRNVKKWNINDERLRLLLLLLLLIRLLDCWCGFVFIGLFGFQGGPVQ